MKSEQGQEMSWTITIRGEVEQIEAVERLIEQFEREVAAVGAESSVMRTRAMAATVMKVDRVEQVMAQMRQQGMSEAQIAHQTAVMRAHMGAGSWAEAVTIVEQELAGYRQKGDLPQEMTALFQLVEYEMNAGEKAKAIEYFQQIDELMKTTSLDDLLGSAQKPLPPAAQNEVWQHYERQLQRLRHWLF